MTDLCVIDGRQGEGGGQVLRTSLALAVALGRPVRIEHVRGGRAKPGLARQHLACVRAAADVCRGEALGAELGSTTVELHPAQRAAAGAYRFAVGSAGSTMLVLQTVLPPLLLADGPSELVLEGGTHNPLAPPFDFVARSFAPLIERMGARLDLVLERPGFVPAGGGCVRVRITPARTATPLELVDRGTLAAPQTHIYLAHIPEAVAAREWRALQKEFQWPSASCTVHHVTESAGPGNAVVVELPSDRLTVVHTSFGDRGASANQVARRVVHDVRRHLASDAPVCEHLADQLMLPMAVLAGGRYRATQLSLHARTNVDVINTFLPGAVQCDGDLVTVRGV